MESLICSIDIPDLNTEISIETENYNSSIISKDNNICLLLLIKNKKWGRSLFFSKSIIIHIGKSKITFKINSNRFQYFTIKKNFLYLKFKAFLNYIGKENEDDKERLIDCTFSFIKKN